jgi:hypothetical protein
MRLVPALVAVIVLAAGCAEVTDRAVPDRLPTASPSPPPHPISLPALFDEDIAGGNLQRRRSLGDFGEYSSWEVTFRSGELTVSGVLNVPDVDHPRQPTLVVVPLVNNNANLDVPSLDGASWEELKNALGGVESTGTGSLAVYVTTDGSTFATGAPEVQRGVRSDEYVSWSILSIVDDNVISRFLVGNT